jgi:hypothetical protein
LTATATYDGSYDNIEAIRELKAEYGTRLQALQGSYAGASNGAGGAFDDDAETGFEAAAWSENTQGNAKGIAQKGRMFVKNHPILVIGGAVTIGFILGAFVGRRSRK